MGSTQGQPSKAEGDAGPSTTVNGLPIREIPGGYGIPVLGAVGDRLAYFWTEGIPNFYENRRKKFNSTVFRMNMIPGPPGFPKNPVVMLLDQKSHKVLLDNDKVEKRDCITGTFVPDLQYFGGYRPTVYLDTSEEKHTLLKGFLFEVLKASRPRIFPEFRKSVSEVFDAWEAGLKKEGKIKFKDELAIAALRFNIKAFLNVDPADPTVEANLGKGVKSTVMTWLAPMFLPIAPAPIPRLLKPVLAPVAELVMHTFPVPFLLVKPKYDQVVKFFRANSKEQLDLAETQFGLNRDEALQNLMFTTCFNSWGGIQILFPNIIKRLASTSPEFQRELREEVRKATGESGGLITPASFSSMPLLQSAVYEVLRMDPPVPSQFGRAREDLIVESHDAAFRVKKGEMLACYLPVIGRDPKIFTSDPQDYNPKRFVGEEGQKLVQYVLWSNGPQTGSPTTTNKQCAGKDFLTTVAQLLVAEVYLRYERIQVDGDNLVALSPPSV
ncbi:hypothetical protein R1flu_024014 [Riccia fluitans]|uniref:Allene oxide synthase n=1 Tax=Riccia fluitans TaxID=41844 RepID=A0ABD1XTN2_9MARC